MKDALFYELMVFALRKQRKVLCRMNGKGYHGFGWGSVLAVGYDFGICKAVVVDEDELKKNLAYPYKAEVPYAAEDALWISIADEPSWLPPVEYALYYEVKLKHAMTYLQICPELVTNMQEKKWGDICRRARRQRVKHAL